MINLIREGVSANKVFHTGNTVIDALLYIVNKRKTENEKKIISVWKDFHQIANCHRLVLVTSHRRENISGTGLTNICNALVDLVKAVPDVAVVFPVHPNPNVSIIVNKILLNQEKGFSSPSSSGLRRLFFFDECLHTDIDRLGRYSGRGPCLEETSIRITGQL